MMCVAAGASGVFDLHPVHAPTGAVRPIPPLRDDTFGTERAGVAEDGFAVAVEVLREADAVLQCRARSIGVPERPAT